MELKYVSPANEMDSRYLLIVPYGIEMQWKNTRIVATFTFNRTLWN